MANYTTVANVRNAVRDIQTVAGGLADAVITEYITQVMGMVNAIVGRDFSTVYDATKHFLLTAATTTRAAIMAIQFDPALFASVDEVTLTIDALWDEWNEMKDLLKEKQVIAYLESL